MFSHHVLRREQRLPAGALIDYRLRLHGLPVGWLTRIEEWVPGERFVDMWAVPALVTRP